MQGASLPSKLKPNVGANNLDSALNSVALTICDRSKILRELLFCESVAFFSTQPTERHHHFHCKPSSAYYL